MWRPAHSLDEPRKRGPRMQPFAQDQNRPQFRRWLLLVLVAAGFGVWFFDLTPEFRSVESGKLTNDLESGAPELPESWDVIVDHAPEESGSDVSSATSDPLLDTIMDPDDPLSGVLSELTEPHLVNIDEADIQVNPSRESGDSQIRPLSLNAQDPGHESTVVTAAGARIEDSVLSAETAAVLRRADEFLRQDQIVEAHGELSQLYWKHPDQRPLILGRIESTAEQIFTDPHRHFGHPYVVFPGDTLESIGRQYNVPWTWLAYLNRLKPQDLQAGQELKVLRGPFSAVIDLSRFELTIHAHGYFVHRYNIGTGRDNRTPVGEFTVQEKVENPAWYNPDGGMVDRDDPQNPLGEYWIGLGNHIGIHGTIDATSIGTSRSRGCIHMRNSDIVEVFGMLGKSSSVRIRE